MFNPDEFASDIHICEFCGVNLDVEHTHTNECPANFIDLNNYEGLLNDAYEIYDDFGMGDAPRNLGLNLMLAADSVIQAQKKWAHQSLMSKFQEVLNRYSDLTNFVNALYKSGILKDAEDILKFLEDPTTYDELFAVWMEFGAPQPESEEAWNLFNNTLNSKGWKDHS